MVFEVFDHMFGVSVAIKMVPNIFASTTRLQAATREVMVSSISGTLRFAVNVREVFLGREEGTDSVDLFIVMDICKGSLLTEN
eukprot:TRINITY_DN13492_c0_g1_i1.p1 TRINITY_DN13492_c0_g1~~TRINITY_DN13492_c0_g1_i1.p1  ORF type:complete len:83 (+),score=2.66 TRINITY_DN13492_c0_g1_i1:337-585(+)